MKDSFYSRLDFYRMLDAGMTNLAEMAEALQISVHTLQRWKKAYQPARSGGQTLLSDNFEEPNQTGRNACPPRSGGIERSQIIEAMRQVALEGNVPAAKLLLTEYQNQPPGNEEVLTVEGAIALLNEWFAEKK